MKTLILAGGGTAGHVTPLLAILPYVKHKFDKIIYIGSGKSIEQNLINPTGIKIYNIKPPAFIRSLTPKNLLIPFKLSKAIKECKQILKKENASVIFSKGGYSALPVCLAGFSLKIPVICHESDLSLGLANALTKRRCQAFFTSFESTAKKHGGIYSGPPLRNELFSLRKQDAKKILGINNEKPVLLITGGSQGSKIINSAIEKNLNKILTNFNVIHLYGKGNKPAYNAINGYLPFEFLDMKLALNACDYCITRGGSNTLFELLYAKKPCIAIPLVKGSRGDQIKNVLHFKKANALLCEQEDNIEKTLPIILDKLVEKSEFLKKNINELNLKNGAKIIATKLEDLSNNTNKCS